MNRFARFACVDVLAKGPADPIGADASTVIKRSGFNAGKYAPSVGDPLTIGLALEAVRA